MKPIVHRLAISVLTLWLVGTAVVIGTLVIGIATNAASSDPTGLMCQR